MPAFTKPTDNFSYKVEINNYEKTLVIPTHFVLVQRNDKTKLTFVSLIDQKNDYSLLIEAGQVYGNGKNIYYLRGNGLYTLNDNKEVSVFTLPERYYNYKIKLVSGSNFYLLCRNEGTTLLKINKCGFTEIPLCNWLKGVDLFNDSNRLYIYNNHLIVANTTDRCLVQEVERERSVSLGDHIEGKEMTKISISNYPNSMVLRTNEELIVCCLMNVSRVLINAETNMMGQSFSLNSFEFEFLNWGYSVEIPYFDNEFFVAVKSRPVCLSLTNSYQVEVRVMIR